MGLIWLVIALTVAFGAGNESTTELKNRATAGDYDAQYLLGQKYEEGEDVSKDYVEAARWYRSAAEHGVHSAQYRLGVMYVEGNGVPQDYVQAHMWLNLAGVTGDIVIIRQRDGVARKMTPDQVAEAQKLTREWKPKNKSTPAEEATPPTPGVAPAGELKESLALEIRTLSRLVQQDPKNRTAWVRLGNLYFDSNQYEPSIEAYSKALELDPDDPDVICDRAIMYRSIGDPQSAADEFRRAATINPSHLNSLLNLGVVLRYDLNDAQGAVEAWEAYLKLDPPAETADRIRRELETLRAKESTHDTLLQRMMKKVSEGQPSAEGPPTVSSAPDNRAVVDWKGGVNVRADPGGKLKQKIAGGTEVEILEERDSWVRIRHADGDGWVVRKSLRMGPDQSFEPPLDAPAEE